MTDQERVLLENLYREWRTMRMWESRLRRSEHARAGMEQVTVKFEQCGGHNGNVYEHDLLHSGVVYNHPIVDKIANLVRQHFVEMVEFYQHRVGQAHLALLEHNHKAKKY